MKFCANHTRFILKEVKILRCFLFFDGTSPVYMNDNNFNNFPQLNCDIYKCIKAKIKFLSMAVLGGTVAFLWTSTNVRLHLPVVGEHDEEEVGGKHPAGKVDRHVQEGEAEGCLAHIEKVQDQTDAIENQPRLHVASIFLQKEPFKAN